MLSQVIKIHPDDNVLVALTDLSRGDSVFSDGVTYAIKSSVPAKHKFAMYNMAPGSRVTMYGVTVG